MSDNKNLTPDPGIPELRMGFSEVGYQGLRKTSNRIVQEANRVFQYPYIIKVINEMKLNPTVNAGLNAYTTMISKTKYQIKPHEEAEEQDIERTAFIRQCLVDMDLSFEKLMPEIVTYLWYGFSMFEIVPRRRLYSKGSRYNDGLIGIKKLSPRAQESVAKWYYEEDKRTLKSVGQSTAYLSGLCDIHEYGKNNQDGYLEIPINRLMIFSADSTLENPQGNSILKSVYLAYKRLELIQDEEAAGIAKDISGSLVIGLPPQYLSANASLADNAVYQTCKTIIEKYNSGENKGFIFPVAYDLQTKQKMFELELLERKSVLSYDLDKVINRYQSDILCALAADVVKMGTNGSGSFALSETKTNLLSLALDYRLKEIASVFNDKLIPLLYDLNRWDKAKMPTMIFAEIEQPSLEEFSKYVQRTSAVGMLEIDRSVLNRVREIGGFEPKGKNEEVDYENLTTAVNNLETGAGEGMAVGTTGDGTSKSVSPEDTSSNNLENKA